MSLTGALWGANQQQAAKPSTSGDRIDRCPATRLVLRLDGSAKSPRGTDLELVYLAELYSPDDLQRVFRDTADMIEFYETRSGVEYPGASYTRYWPQVVSEQEITASTAPCRDVREGCPG